MAFEAMKVQNFPDIDLPTVTVTAALPGASPAQLETDVARKIENSIATLQGVKHIYTKVQDGVVDDHGRVPPREADAGGGRRRARRRVARALRPAGRPARPDRHQVRPRRLADPRPTRSRRRRMDDEALSWFVDNTVTRSAARACAASARSTRVGGVTREVRVELDPARLLALNATAADISRQLRQMQRESVGRPHRRRRRRAVGAHASPPCSPRPSWRSMEIALADGRHIRLDQVATRQRHRRRAALGRAA